MTGSVITLRSGQRMHLEDVSVTKAKHIRRQKAVIFLAGPKGTKVPLDGKNIIKIETVPAFLA